MERRKRKRECYPRIYIYKYIYIPGNSHINEVYEQYFWYRVQAERDNASIQDEQGLGTIQSVQIKLGDLKKVQRLILSSRNCTEIIDKPSVIKTIARGGYDEKGTVKGRDVR